MISEKKKNFLEDVRHEVKMLGTHATLEEKRRLNFAEFNPKFPRSCIYGQVAHGCFTIRAKELMDISCRRILDLPGSGVHAISEVEIDSDSFNINGEYAGQTWTPYGHKYKYLSALEGYICTKNANIQGIMSYLRGETETLEL